MNPHKKNIELTGSLIYPIEVGEAAFIREADGMRSQNTDEAQGHPAASTAPATPAAAPANNGGFTGYESFGGGNSFFDEN